MISIVNNHWTYIVPFSLFSYQLEPLRIWGSKLPAGPRVVEFTLCHCDRTDAGPHCADHLETATEYS